MHQVSPTIYIGMYWSERLRVAPVFELSEAQEAELTRLARSVRSSVRMSLRARIQADSGLPIEMRQSKYP